MKPGSSRPSPPRVSSPLKEWGDLLDPQQTTLPDGWKKLPCYSVHAGNTVKLSVQRLGDSQPLPDELRLDRQIFLTSMARALPHPTASPALFIVPGASRPALRPS